MMQYIHTYSIYRFLFFWCILASINLASMEKETTPPYKYISLQKLHRTIGHILATCKIDLFAMEGDHSVYGSEKQNLLFKEFPALKDYLSKKYIHYQTDIPVQNRTTFLKEIEAILPPEMNCYIMNYFKKELAIAAFKNLKPVLYNKPNRSLILPFGNIIVEDGFISIPPAHTLITISSHPTHIHFSNQERITFMDRHCLPSAIPAYLPQKKYSNHLIDITYGCSRNNCCQLLTIVEIPPYEFITFFDLVIVALPNNGEEPLLIHRPSDEILSILKTTSLSLFITTLDKQKGLDQVCGNNALLTKELLLTSSSSLKNRLRKVQCFFKNSYMN